MPGKRLKDEMPDETQECTEKWWKKTKTGSGKSHMTHDLLYKPLA